jgi:outer membrane receptor for ferrienterochelin and colicins
VARARSRGVEASARVALARALSLSGNYTYVDARNRVSGVTLPTVYVPHHSAHLTLDGEGGGLGWYATVSYVGHQYLAVFADARRDVTRAGYATADLGISLRVTAHATLRGGLLNLLDRSPQRRIGADRDIDGRRAFVAVTTGF